MIYKNRYIDVYIYKYRKASKQWIKYIKIGEANGHPQLEFNRTHTLSLHIRLLNILLAVNQLQLCDWESRKQRHQDIAEEIKHRITQKKLITNQWFTTLYIDRFTDRNGISETQG